MAYDIPAYGDFFGAYPEGCPSNDPEQRGDADGDGQRPDVNREPFDRKYTSHGLSPFKPNDVTIVAKPSDAGDLQNPNAQTPVGF